MSTLKAKNIQIGVNTIEVNNYTLYQKNNNNSPDGTLRISLGNSGVLNPSDILIINGNSETVLEVIGNVGASGEFISLSDFSLKENIESIDNPLNTIDGLNGIFFNFVDEDRRQVGFIAQEVEEVLPEVVFETDGIKSVSYAKVVAVLVEAVKELKKEIEELKSNI